LKSLFHWLRSLKPATDYIVVAPEGLVEEDVPSPYCEACGSCGDDGCCWKACKRAPNCLYPETGEV
jgi:hypothetical protein